MANTYTQLYVQIIFAVYGRQNIIRNEHKEEIYKYITGIVKENGHKMLAINGMPDHIHVLVGLHPKQAISDLVRDIKSNSSGFINNKKQWYKRKFNWQEGYGAFSYSRSHIDRVIKYIMNQEAHHRRLTFKEEYIELLKRFEIEYDEKYLFKWIEY